VAYGGSPLVEGPGKRYLDDSMRGGRGIVSRFLLMLGSDVGMSTKEAATRLAASFGNSIEVRPGSHEGMTLVRPDGYVAYSGGSREGTAALTSMRSLLERQLIPEAAATIAVER
jgi:hypothetical protein